MSYEDSSDGDSTWKPSSRRSKRIKTNSGRPAAVGWVKPSTPHSQSPYYSLDSLLEISIDEVDFEDILPKEDYLATRMRHLENNSEADAYGYRIRPLTTAEIYGLRPWLQSKTAMGTQPWTNGDAILMRRLQLRQVTPEVVLPATNHSKPHPQILALPAILPPRAPPNQDTISALNSIHTTPYYCSFASRLRGGGPQQDSNSYLIHRDSETQAPWIELLKDIRLHYSLSHPACETPEEIIAPIDYVSLQRSHLLQVHDLLSRAFWPGIDVSDSLQYSPTQCTIVSVYKKLVVGAAFLSSPEETYLTYLVVRPGWENANIASVMLYHLITANPRKDITLHVSANNPAMLLYNKFGFKAEEFIVGFYDDYLPSQSRACKNAFRLRLRR